MLSDQDLQKRTQHKQPRWRALPIGRLLQRYSREALVRQESSAAKLNSALAQFVDAEFMAHCRSLCVRAGTLIIEMDAPALAYDYRRKYLFLLREHLAQAMPQARIVDIRFSIGT